MENSDKKKEAGVDQQRVLIQQTNFKVTDK